MSDPSTAAIPYLHHYRLPYSFLGKMAHLRDLGSSYDQQPAPLALPRDKFLSICHPGYVGPPRHHCLLKLPVVDCRSVTYPTSNTEGWGLHYGFVLRACEIITNNRPGFLSNISPGELLAENDDWNEIIHQMYEAINLEDILAPSTYYFYVLDFPTNKEYGVCGSFEQWNFPDTLPCEWIQPVSLQFGLL